MWVPETGGAAAPLTLASAKGAQPLYPLFLPDGRHFLYFAPGAPDVRGVYVGDVTKPETRRVVDSSAAAVYTSDHLLFVRQEGLFAQRFDPA